MSFNLNEKQLQAINHIDGPCIVLAGPGSGKTNVITHRILNLVENKNINPLNILAISFTKASAVEMKEKTIRLSKTNAVSKVNFGTFHSVFFNILRTFKKYTMENVLDEKEKKYIFKNILKTCQIENCEDDDFIFSVMSEVSFVKNDLANLEDFKSNNLSKQEFVRVYNMYEKYKLDMKKIDFDDMLLYTYDFLKNDKYALDIIKNKYKYILIDEFQDINKVQFEVLKIITNKEKNIFVVGDEDQSIYGFRGSKPDFLFEFERYFHPTKKIILDINYRCTSEIIKASNKLICNNQKRYQKHIKPVKQSHKPIIFQTYTDSEQEAKKIANIIKEKIKNEETSFLDFAVIYRTNMQSRAIIDVFMDMNIPFVVKDSIVTIYDHWISKDIISYLKLALNINLKEEFSRIINRPFRYISKESIKKALENNNFIDSIKKDLQPWQLKTVEDLEIDINYMKFLSPKEAISYIRTNLEYDRYIIDYCLNRKISNVSLFEILDEIESSSENFKTINEYLDHIEKVKQELSIKNSKDDDRVILTTIHSAKGLEFKYVFIIGAIEGVMPHEKSLEDDELIEEERRLFYVAMTRAKDELYISSLKSRYGKKVYVSRFIEEISELLSSDRVCIKKGDIIYHNIFKVGKVIDKKENIITVKFENELKNLDYNICLDNNIIQKL
ncbi:DNA helicase-2 / ATP-dependent DNA helicase PcrA [Alkalithermobacter thermoalcaliphilus JW-YL-7 = DSM 7308]|uniref:DNA 3'-5' helicase n=1 Tax=Alkalithermobacter thermoalcaliphilus JW-YL-7 = DSM 7308 TaxID=1121328 RepID=A0A150FP06_CLOPD|nr:UvrD-like DNA helicase [[Clostridium] paradoxum JW-YL-7 = DSM 7308]SHK54603.1 DNA helicase-2 / ATP-dependent DNA helicase PcrA [[Clostridium] paradoxum JW-YL-7 = DSM 7308]